MIVAFHHLIGYSGLEILVKHLVDARHLSPNCVGDDAMETPCILAVRMNSLDTAGTESTYDGGRYENCALSNCCRHVYPRYP